MCNSSICSSPKRNEKAMTRNVLVPGPHTFSPAISELREAAETVWRRVIIIMAIVKNRRFVLLQFSTAALCFLLKKSPFTLEFQMLRGQKVSRLLATSSKFLVANAQFLVALATSQSQCRTLPPPSSKWASSQVDPSH